MVEIASGRATVDLSASGGFQGDVDAYTANQSSFDPQYFAPSGFAPFARANDLLDVKTEVDTDQVRVLRPRANDVGVQRVGVRIYLESDGGFDPMFFGPAGFGPGGTRLDPLLVGPVTVSRSVDSAIQTASADFAYVDGKPPLGSELRLGAPATGKKACTLSVAYRDASHIPFEEVLIGNGIADDTRTSWNGVKTQSLQLADAGRRWVGNLATKIIPAGSNLRRDRAIEALARAGGVTQFDLPVFEGRLLKPVDLAEGDWLSVAQAIADVEGFRLLWSPAGYLAAVQLAPEIERAPIKWLYTEADVCIGANGSQQSVEIFPAPEAWTSVEARGTRQVTRGANCGLETVLLKALGLVQTIGPAQPWRQTTGGSVVATGATEHTYGSPVIGSETLKNVTTECREIVSERTRVYAYVNPLRARYLRDTAGAISSYLECYLLEDEASAIGHRNSLPTRMQVSEVIFSRLFDAGGNLVQERETTKSLYIPRRHVKSRAARSDDWETATADSNWYDLGDGTGVTDTNQALIQTEVKTVKFENGSDGYLRERVTTVQRYAKRPGFQYLYGDGSSSSDSEETFQTVEEVREQWLLIREGLYAETVQSYGLNGEFAEASQETKLGAPPGVVTLESITPQRADFDTDAEFEAALAASRFEQEEMAVTCDAPALLDVRPERRLAQAFFEWAETPGELGRICDRLLLLGMSPGISFTVPINARLREGDMIHVRLRPLGVDHDVAVKSVEHTVGLDVPCLTRVSGVIWPEL